MIRFHLIALSLILTHLFRTEQNLLGSKHRLTRDEIHSEEFAQILSSAVQDCNREHSSDFWHRQETVSDATKQLVQGTNYEFTVRLRETSCLKKPIINGEKKESDDDCLVKHNSPLIICSTAVWFRPWLKEKIQVTVRGHWKVTSEKFSLQEIHSAIAEQSDLAQKFAETMQKAVEDYNLQKKPPFLVRYAGLGGRFRQMEEPRMLANEVSLKATSCKTPTDRNQFEQLQSDECYNTTGQDYACGLRITDTLDNATLINCEPTASALGGLWRLSAPKPVDGNQDREAPKLLGAPKPKSRIWKEHWSSEPLDIFLLSINRDMSMEELETEEMRALRRELVFTYNAQINAMYMFTLASLRNVQLQEEPEKLYTLTARMQETNCKKSDYLNNLEAFEKNCHTLDSMKPQEECKLTAMVTGKPEKPYKIILDKCKRLTFPLLTSLGGRSPVSATDRAGQDFQNLLKRVAKSFNEQSDSGILFEVDKAENVLSQIVSGQMYFMNVTFKANGCKPTAKRPCYQETEKHTYQCNVEVYQNPSDNLGESINISNCRHLLESVNPVEGKWTELKGQSAGKDEFQQIVKKAVQVYNDVYSKKKNWILFYVDDVLKLTGKKELFSFILHMKKEKSDIQKKCHVTILNPSENTRQIAIRNCVTYRQPKVMVGAPQPLDEDAQEKEDFHALIKKAAALHHKEAESRYFHRIDRVENPTTQVVAGTLIRFKIHLQPTSCLKAKHKDEFEKGKFHTCGPVNITHVVVCDVEVWRKPWMNFEEIKLQSCELQRRNSSAQGMIQTTNQGFLSKPYFQEMLDRATIVINTQMDNKVFYKRITVENITRQLVNGYKYTFEMGLISTLCLRDEDFTSFTVMRWSKCTGKEKWHSPNIIDWQYMVQCRVQAWKRPWLQNSRLVIVDKCKLIHENRSALFLSSLGAPDRGGVNMTYVADVLPRLVKMFNRRENLTYTYEKQNIEKLEQQIVAGLKLNFDLFLKPQPGSSKCANKESSTRNCPPENGHLTDCNATWVSGNGHSCFIKKGTHFYLCKASVWLREWMNSEILSLDDCMMVEMPKSTLIGVPQPLEVKKSNPKLKDITERATKLYNEKLADDFVFGNGQISDAEEQVVAGLLTKFKLRLEPVACKLNANRRRCDVRGSRLRVECQVLFWERPWLDESEKIALENCRRFFDDGTAANHEVRLSREEEQSEDFKAMLDQMAKLYQPGVPIIYDVDKILNARVKDQVSCEGQISEHPTGYRTMSLRNCRVLWKTESERALTKSEQASKWFRQSVHDAIKLHQSSVASNNLFKLRSIENGTLRRSDIELIKYRMILTETDCAKSEHDIGSDDDQCPEKEPAVSCDFLPIPLFVLLWNSQ
ncbi:unnamed protein product [Echinostoma caproni]|uniref:Cystatin domain-containing protein n=1 Tax=Echinostoma caproni TaxID=27848 RepID=A0A183ACM7_9TREM|nr:unnamed protein product [Echinostoma caproni]